ELPDDVDNRLHKALPGEIRETRNIDYEGTTLTDFIVLGLQRSGVIRMLREHAGVPRRLETTANRRAHPFILGKFEFLGHVDEVLDTNERRRPALPLHMPGFLEQACHAVLEIHRRHIRQAKPGQHGNQRTESELPYAELEVVSSL